MYAHCLTTIPILFFLGVVACKHAEFFELMSVIVMTSVAPETDRDPALPLRNVGDINQYLYFVLPRFEEEWYQG